MHALKCNRTHCISCSKPHVEGEQHKISVIMEANAIVHPGAMMIHSQYAPEQACLHDTPIWLMTPKFMESTGNKQQVVAGANATGQEQRNPLGCNDTRTQ